MYKQIEQIIKSKNNKLKGNTLRYFTNYFYVAFKKDVIPDSISLEELIDNTLHFVKKIVFYDNSHKMYKKLGPDVKGTIDPKTKILYIRDDLSEPLKEMTVYHEIHNAAQTKKDSSVIGINIKDSIGCMILEAETQWFAEEVYKEIYDMHFNEIEIPSEKLRMMEGGTIVSALHNYEMFDSMLTKLSIILDKPKEYFVKINYLNEKGLKILEENYNEKAKEKNITTSFYDILYLMDYAYVVDYVSYVKNTNKKVLLSGKETSMKYQIYPNISEKLSLREQSRKIDAFDTILILALIENGFDFIDFAKYVFNNERRGVLSAYLESKGKNF